MPQPKSSVRCSRTPPSAGCSAAQGVRPAWPGGPAPGHGIRRTVGRRDPVRGVPRPPRARDAQARGRVGTDGALARRRWCPRADQGRRRPDRGWRYAGRSASYDVSRSEVIVDELELYSAIVDAQRRAARLLLRRCRRAGPRARARSPVPRRRNRARPRAAGQREEQRSGTRRHGSPRRSTSHVGATRCHPVVEREQQKSRATPRVQRSGPSFIRWYRIHRAGLVEVSKCGSGPGKWRYALRIIFAVIR